MRGSVRARDTRTGKPVFTADGRPAAAALRRHRADLDDHPLEDLPGVGVEHAPRLHPGRDPAVVGLGQRRLHLHLARVGDRSRWCTRARPCLPAGACAGPPGPTSRSCRPRRCRPSEPPATCCRGPSPPPRPRVAPSAPWPGRSRRPRGPRPPRPKARAGPSRRRPSSRARWPGTCRHSTAGRSSRGTTASIRAFSASTSALSSAARLLSASESAFLSRLSRSMTACCRRRRRSSIDWMRRDESSSTRRSPAPTSAPSSAIQRICISPSLRGETTGSERTACSSPVRRNTSSNALRTTRSSAGGVRAVSARPGAAARQRAHGPQEDHDGAAGGGPPVGEHRTHGRRSSWVRLDRPTITPARCPS